MRTYRVLFSTLHVVVVTFFFSPALVVAQEKESLKLLVRQTDGGQHKGRHLKKIKRALSNNGCRVEVGFIDKDSATPDDTDLEFSPDPIDQTKSRLPNFRLIAQARTIEGETKIGSAILVIAATGVDSLTLLAGERFSFVTPFSVTGYQLPIQMLADAGVKPTIEQTIFVGNHVGAVSMLLHGDTFAAAAAAPLARDWLSINKELAIVALSPLVETGGWWINKRVEAGLAMTCAINLAQLTGSQLKVFPAWVGGFNPQ
ncbi:MAG: PhnD/SsuA/transferrin family substrate-binding protein [Magnetococcales bacterium]|nr:PhnD/SsuA/transferrin family substrate-binding protein [Magnetococcales bacterium]